MHQRSRCKEFQHSHAHGRFLPSHQPMVGQADDNQLHIGTDFQTLADGTGQNYQHIVFCQCILFQVQTDAHEPTQTEHGQSKGKLERISSRYEIGHRVCIKTGTDVVHQHQVIINHQCPSSIGQHQQMQFLERYIFFFHDSLLSDIGAKIVF